jgi:hypothetical protein
MSWISWLIGFGLITSLTAQAVRFHRATVCRQEAWLKSTELRTSALLDHARKTQKAFHTGCHTSFYRYADIITWRKWNESKKKIFELDLKGKL